MGVKESLERWLFWAERMGFLIMALACSLLETTDGWGWVSNDTFWDCTAYLKLFWKCTNFLYFLLYAGRRLYQFREKQIGHTTPSTKPLLPQGKPSVHPAGFLFEQLAVLIWEIGVWFVKTPGFLLERLALLAWTSYIGVPEAYWSLHSSLYMIIFPLLNIYFAWVGYSSEFQPDLHQYQKKLVEGKNVTRAATEESIKQPHSTHVYGGAARVLFWVERLGFSILTLAWFYLSIVNELPSWDLLLKCITMVHCFWVCTNFLYFSVCVGRQLAENNMYKRLQLLARGKEKQNSIILSLLWLVNNFKNYPGFWLERLVLLLLAYGLDLFVSSRGGGDIVLDLCVIVIFPLFHIYFAWFGYLKEFQTKKLLVKKVVKLENSSAKEEIQQRQNLRQNLGPSSDSLAPTAKFVGRMHQSDEAKTLMLDKKDSSSSPSASSVTNDFRMMLESLEDRICMKIVNAIEESQKKYSMRCEDACQTALKLKEQNHELTMKLSVATASSQLYRTLLHDNICISDQ